MVIHWNVGGLKLGHSLLSTPCLDGKVRDSRWSSQTGSWSTLLEMVWLGERSSSHNCFCTMKTLACGHVSC